jgi:antitoxin (DNA-binding transcriptional repressor) of toxin-antitoxin stability system
MQTISKSKLKAKMLRIFREIEASGEELIVTDRGRPVLSIRPLNKGRTVEEVFADYRGKVVFCEDPDTPTSDDWEDLE